MKTLAVMKMGPGKMALGTFAFIRHVIKPGLVTVSNTQEPGCCELMDSTRPC
jgi:hypothetical protein